MSDKSDLPPGVVQFPIGRHKDLSPLHQRAASERENERDPAREAQKCFRLSVIFGVSASILVLGSFFFFQEAPLYERLIYRCSIALIPAFMSNRFYWTYRQFKEKQYESVLQHRRAESSMTLLRLIEKFGTEGEAGRSIREHLLRHLDASAEIEAGSGRYLAKSHSEVEVKKSDSLDADQ